jgi:serine/threonine-protein kinase
VRQATHALVREEAARARGFAQATTLLAVLGLAAQPLLGGETWLHVLGVLALCALLVEGAWLWRVARDPLRYTGRALRRFAIVAGVASLVVEYHLGVVSPAPMLVTFGIAFLALSDDRVVSLAVPIAAAGLYGLLAAGIVFGIVPDAGVLHALDTPRNVALAIVASVPLVQMLALWHGRASRRAIVDAIARSNFDMRDSVMRDVEQEDEKRDLDRLLRMGGPRAGTCTGQSAGAWLLGDLIGRGAMGEVYRATHSAREEQAAIKLLLPNMAEDANLVARFLREGEAASKLRGPNVVAITEVGRMSDGSPYIAMELLRGHDLAWHLERRGTFSIDEVVGVVEQVAIGLEAARIAGIVHRDLKPQNLFLAQQERAAPLWKILDFGVSRFAGSHATLTQDQIVGTPGYMAPEQAAGGEATHRSDVFSFGVVIYRALTGVPAFWGNDAPQILYQVVYTNPQRPSEILSTISQDVEVVVAIALAKEPEDRFASALALSAALRDAASGDLDPAVRLHGRTLLAALPWGGSTRGARDDRSLG